VRRIMTREKSQVYKGPMRCKIAGLAIVFEGGLLLLAWGLGWLLDAPPFARASLAWTDLGLGIAATLPPLAGMWLCSRSRWAPLRKLMHAVEEKLIPAFAGCSRLDLALISTLAGLGEEALFRGVLQSALAEWFHPWSAVLAVSLLFGLGHFVTPVYALLAAVIGLYLGILFMVTDNLYSVVLVHTLYDFVALVYLIRRYRLNRAQTTLMTEG
jgi:uncharacterized protein